MKPLLILAMLISSLFITSVANAEWTKVVKGKNNGATIYIDFDRIRKTGIKTYFWKLVDYMLENGKLTPSANFELRYNSRGSLNQITSYADTPSESTVYNSTPAPSEIQSLGLGLRYQAESGISSDLRWLWSNGSNSYHSNAIKLNMTVPF